MSTPSPVRHGRVGASCRRAFLASLIALGAAGCGGGSGSDTPSPEATAPVGGAGLATYAGGALSGRLIVQATDGPSTAFDLRTGQRHVLPQSTAGGKTDWHGGTGKATVLRGARDGVHPAQTLEPLRASDWTPSGATIRLATYGTRPTLSLDGRYVLTFWQTGTDSSDRRLTIFDVATGQPVKRGSALDGQIVTGGPAAWLPDGRYLYLAGRNLYESSPTASASILRATLSALPDNSFAQNNVDLDSNASYLTVSPDGTKIAFTWRTVRRNVTDDSNLWVANVDGSGLRQLTAPVDPASPLTYAYGSPTWSPDSQWVAGVLYMNGSVVAPIFPPDQSFPGVPGGIIGATGCATNPVFVLPANAEKVALSWPTFDVRYGVKVLNAQGNGGQWLGACSSIEWIE